MNIRDALRDGTARLREAPEAAGVDTPHLDAMVLLAYCLGVEKEVLFREPERELPPPVLEAFENTLEKRFAGIPVSYIRRRKEFYGRDFYVDERVLVPRPDTETLIETALELILADSSIRRIHDCCTGAGTIAVTLKAETAERGRADLEISASDVSPEALEVASLNVRRLLATAFGGGEHEETAGTSGTDETASAAALPLRHSDLLEGVAEQDLITANPPYVRREEYRKLARAAWPEPALALDGGPDGLEVLRRLIPAAFESLRPYGYFLCEIGYDQGDAARELAWKNGFVSIRIVPDLGGRDRVLCARRGGPGAPDATEHPDTVVKNG